MMRIKKTTQNIKPNHKPQESSLLEVLFETGVAAEGIFQ
jgi:hypothetical protein